MMKDFNNFGHKNAELLRHYIVKEIREIDKKLTDNSNHVAGYLYASFVDILIVMIFDDFLKKASICFRIILAVILILVFMGVSAIVSHIKAKRHVNLLIEGRQKYDKDNIEKYIDEFDNVACDGLLICQNYMKKYMKSKECPEIKEFYFYEIVHHLKKSINIFEQVYGGKNSCLYIRRDKDDSIYKIDEYRTKNFIKICTKIYDFVKTESKNSRDFQDKLLTCDIENIHTKLKELK